MASPVTPGVDLVSFAHPVLINLPEREDRLVDSLAELSIAAGRPVAVGDDVHLIRPERFSDAAGFANPGYRSNTHAHLQAATWAKERGLERVLVLEDDLAFGPAWSMWGSRLVEALATGSWDLANLGYLDVWNEAPTVPDEPIIGGGGTGVDPAGWARFAGKVNGAHAYLLAESILDDWIAHLEAVLAGRPGDDLRGPMASDGAINTFFWVHSDRVRLLAVPNLVGTRPTRSDIDPGRIDRLPMVRSVVESARRWNRRRGRRAINYR
ncbi:MAG: hypothetical protein AAGA93_21330 [Actinomycetota bacterium]